LFKCLPALEATRLVAASAPVQAQPVTVVEAARLRVPAHHKVAQAVPTAVAAPQRRAWQQAARVEPVPVVEQVHQVVQATVLRVPVPVVARPQAELVAQAPMPHRELAVQVPHQLAAPVAMEARVASQIAMVATPAPVAAVALAAPVAQRKTTRVLAARAARPPQAQPPMAVLLTAAPQRALAVMVVLAAAATPVVPVVLAGL
jgi:hypothetical protein